MTGTDEDNVAAADDALYVLTAVLLTPASFPSVLGDDYPEACAALDLAPVADGYGLVLGQDGDGARWTVAVDDASLVAVAIASWDCGMEYDLSPDDRSVVTALPGWPLALAVSAPDVPTPHDPDPADVGRPALIPPGTSVWGPAQRRLGADEIALQWASWREQIDDADFVRSTWDRDVAGESGSSEDTASAQESDPAQDSERAQESDPGQKTDPAREPESAPETGPAGALATEKGEGTESAEDEGSDDIPDDKGGGTLDKGAGSLPEGNIAIRRVLAEARAYLDTPPPLGRVRSSFAPGEARTLRADGPGWSMVARTDDIAFILLDDMPGEVLPVGRGPELPGLLAALDKMAVRPA